MFIGLDDRTGNVVGVANADAEQKRVGKCMDECYPAIAYSCRVLETGGKYVVAVIVPASTNRPHFTGGAFVRVGSESKRASEAQFNEVILSRDDLRRQILQHKMNGIVSVRGVGYQLLSFSWKVVGPPAKLTSRGWNA